MTEIKKKRGRPKLDAGKALETTLVLRLSDQEKAAFEVKASKKGLSLSAWARLVLKEAQD